MSIAKHSHRQPINKQQIKAIHSLKNAIGMDDETYRAMLKDFGGVESSTAITSRQADALIEEMKTKAGQKPWFRRKADRHVDLEGRPGMATAPQLRKIEALWDDVSRVIDPEQRAKALRSFIFRVAKVSDLRFLDRAGAGKVITALEAMSNKAKSVKTQI